MKNLTKLLALATLAFFTSCDDHVEDDKGMEMGNLYVSKSKPQPGDEILIKYSGDHTEIPEATVNYLVGSSFYPSDIELKDSAEAYYASITIPDTVQAIAFNFKNGNNYEANNKQGYVISLYDENTKELKGATAAKGIYYLRNAEQFNVKMDADSALAMIEKDLQKNPDLIADFEVQYSNALMKADRKKGTSYIDDRIAAYLEQDSLNADDYEALYYLYDNKGAKKESDSISNIALEKYPKSKMAKRNLMIKIVQSPKLEEKLEYFQTYEDQIGSKGYEKDIMLRFIANEYANEKNWDSFEKYASQIENPASKASVYNSAAWKMAENGEDLDTAEKLIKKSLEVLNSTSGDSPHKPDYYTKKQYQKSLDNDKAMFSDTYGLIKFKQGDLEKAIEVQEAAISENSGADVNTRYVQFLTEAGKSEKAVEKAEEFIKDNRASSEMEQYLKTSYSKIDREEGYESYLASIKEEAKTNAMEDLKNSMLNEEAPSFKLKDLKGNEIALADLKGKTVILDFWATWCGPCKMSFPGMQKAVEKYQDNPDVEFLFVDTFETGEERESKVEDFITTNEYSFHVLIDNPVAEGSREFATAGDYGITGIPTKVIIGPEGKINFKVVGYDGNNEKLLQEIGLMIDLTQKNKKPEA